MSARGPARSSPIMDWHPAHSGDQGRPGLPGRPERDRPAFPWRLSRSEGFNRVTVQVDPQKVRYLVNGHLFYEDDEPSPTSPWLGLLSSPRAILGLAERLRSRESRRSPARSSSVRATGSKAGSPASTANPAAPADRGVRPTSTATLSRFSAAALDVAAGPAAKRAVKKPNAGQARRLRLGGPGRRDPRPPRPPPTPRYAGRTSFLAILPAWAPRPTRAGSTIIARSTTATSTSYEFLYEPGQVMVHPAIDRLAFLLEPEGVKVHWMTAGGSDLSGLPADNAADEPANRRGPKRAPAEARPVERRQAGAGRDQGHDRVERPARSTSGLSSRASAGSSACSITRTRPPRRRATSCSGATGPKT